MPNMKATDLVVLKKIFAERDGSLEAAFIDALPPEWRATYENIMFTTRLPVEVIDTMYDKAASILFPGVPDKYLQFGRLVAERSFSTVYKVFMRVPTRNFVISRAASVWQSYHESGNAAIENLTQVDGDFVVRNYPELPRVLRLVASGHLEKMLELIGTKNIRTQHFEDNPQEWRWHLEWDV